MSELLLLSNSRAPGTRFLEHAVDAIRDVLGDRSSVLFVPFACSDPDSYTRTMREALGRIDVRVMPIVEAASLSALGLIPFQLNPHYLDPDPGSSHQGETRQQRIEEFLEENDVPVLGLREGSWLRVSGPRAVLAGTSSGRLFRRHAEPAEVPPGTDLSCLLDVKPHFDVGIGQ